jgi:hypothetical protein
MADLAAIRRIPSITSWTRIEPKPRDGTLARGLQAQVRDAAWMLSRQWQIGEFQGEDAGSPVRASLAVDNRTISTYRPGANTAATVAYDPSLPLEVHVEREPVRLKLRTAADLGFLFEDLVRGSGVADPDATIASFRTAFPIAATVTADDKIYEGDAGLSFRALAAGRVVDGEALYASATGAPGAAPMPAEASQPGMDAVIQAFVAYRGALFSQPANDRAWQPLELAYDFAVGSPLAGDNVVLEADGFPGGHLDWCSFRYTEGGPPASGLPSAGTSSRSFEFLPQHVVFKGMPGPRWWNFETGSTDFGRLDTETVDLAKMLVMEFALTYGNDWFIIPVPTDVGTLSAVTTLVVTDTFGERTLIRSAETTAVAPGDPVWSMFKLSGPAGRSPFILVPPSLGTTDEGKALERVNFLRDEMAAMAWAVEHALHGSLDVAIDPYQAYLARIAADPPPKPTQQPGDPPIYYTLEGLPPDNWIPLVPVKAANGALYLRRGVVERPVEPDPAHPSGFAPNLAHADVLEPGQPFFLRDHIVPRAGIQAEVRFRRARGTAGETYLWRARKRIVGRGPGWSGLRFDFIETFKA